VSSQTPTHEVIAVDESLFVDELRLFDRNALVDIALRVHERISEANHGIVLVLDRCENIGRRYQGTLRSVGREQRRLVHQAIGVVPVLRGLLSELDALNIRCGLVSVSRESFADRRQYFGVRDVVRGLLRNGAVPLIVDACEPISSTGTPRADYLQIAGMLAGMLGAESLDVYVSDSLQLEFLGPEGLVRDATIDEFDALWRGSQIRARADALDLVEPLLAAARLVAHGGATITLRSGGLSPDRPDAAFKLSPATDRRPMTGVQRWLVAGAVPEGAVIASEYAASKLTQSDRGSLLAAGVVRCEGSFKTDAVVSVLDEDGHLLGYGVTRYGTADLERVKGKPDVVVVHADHFFGVGLRALATST
jgi:glutamate 5-kinase